MLWRDKWWWVALVWCIYVQMGVDVYVKMSVVWHSFFSC